MYTCEKYAAKSSFVSEFISQEETDSHQNGEDCEDGEGKSGKERLGEVGEGAELRDTSLMPGSGEVKMGSFVGGRGGVVSQMRSGNRGSGNRPSNSNTQVYTHGYIHVHVHSVYLLLSVSLCGVVRVLSFLSDILL